MQRGTRGMAPIGLDDMAILVRASHQMRAFEDRFLTIGLPYRVIGGPRFYERMEIRDAMAYFRLVVSPEDDLAFERVVNTPKRGLGDKAQQKIQMAARTNGVSLLEGAKVLLAAKGLTGKGAKELQRFVEGIERWRGLMMGPMRAAGPVDDLIEEDVPPGTLNHVELAEMILDESGYTEMWQLDKTPEAPGRLENLKELVKALESFENLQGFLEHVSLIMDNESDETEEKVTLMTLHAAKGLEFPAVFLPVWEDGLFPSQRAMDEEGLKGLEEERRLAYVGITRAMQHLVVTYAESRRLNGRDHFGLLSRFIREIPQECIEEVRLETQVSRPFVSSSFGARPVDRPHRHPRFHDYDDGFSEDTGLGIGSRVDHGLFGEGTILSFEGSGPQMKVQVRFDDGSKKWLVLQYAKLVPLG